MKKGLDREIIIIIGVISIIVATSIMFAAIGFLNIDFRTCDRTRFVEAYSLLTGLVWLILLLRKC